MNKANGLKILLVTVALGLCEVGETTPPRAARVASNDRVMIIRDNRLYQSVRRTRRRPAKSQYITSEPQFLAPAPVLIDAAPVKRKHYFSGEIVQFATGLNAGYATTNTAASGQTRNAFAFSMMFEKKLNNTFYLCPEIAYVQRGVQTNLMTFPNMSVVGNVQLNYLELPLLLKAKLDIMPRWKVFFVGGPTVGLILNRQVEVLGLVNLDLANRFNQVDVGVVVGTGVEFQATPDFAIVGHLRNQIGLINLDQTPNTTFYTRGIQLLIGAQFRL